MKTILLRLIHHLITLGDFVKCMFLFIPYVDVFSFMKKSTQTLAIKSDAKSLNKIPNHLGLLIAEDEFSFRDVANIVVWAVTMGISYISIYDINGEIKRKSSFLQENMEAVSEEVMGRDKSNYDIQLYSSTQAVKQGGTAHTKVHQTRVCLLCLEDGQRSIVGVAKRLGKMVSSGSYRLDDVVPSNVDAFMMESLRLPDPELCLKFGATHSLLGYLPWHVRLTEFIFVPSHKGLTYKSFFSSLRQYAGTSQRFGK